MAEETDDTTATPPAAADSSQDDAALLASLEPEKPEPAPFDADTLKLLDNIDPTKLPEALRRKLEAPFHSDYTKKTQSLAEDRRKLDEDRVRDRQTFLSLVDRLTKAQGHEATPDQKAELMERIRGGETELVDKLIDMKLEEVVGPRMARISQKEALDEAVRLFPAMPQYEAQVANELKADPELLRLATMENNRYAGKILAGLGAWAHSQKLQQEFDEYRAGEGERAKKAIESWKAEVRKLPTATSRAGVTSVKEGKEAAKSFREAAEEAYAEVTGTVR